MSKEKKKKQEHSLNQDSHIQQYTLKSSFENIKLEKSIVKILENETEITQDVNRKKNLNVRNVVLRYFYHAFKMTLVYFQD